MIELLLLLTYILTEYLPINYYYYSNIQCLCIPTEIIIFSIVDSKNDTMTVEVILYNNKFTADIMMNNIDF